MANRSHIINIYLLIALCVVAAGACSSSRPYSLDPIKTFDPDNKDIPPPSETVEHFSWETLYFSAFYQIEKPLDLGWSLQKMGRFLGLNGYDEAENVNVLDEVPNSSWYTRRHYFNPMSIEALQQGPNIAGGPDTTQTITVTRGKSEGVTPGFTIRDATGNTFLIKLDDPDFPEMSSAAEVIVTKLFYAAGYFTPQNSLLFLDPEQLIVGEKATITKNGRITALTRADLNQMLQRAYKRNDGKVRALASKLVEGQPLGPWSFLGIRKDDPNDRIPHEDRREVRGLRVLASWVNDTDRRKANTLAVYVDENADRYIRHYLLDMGSTLGASGTSLRHTKRGQEYRYDPRYMSLSYITLGFYVKPWALPEAQNRPFYPSIGYYEAELFDPGNWVPSYPNPAFEKVTARDGFWGAKMVVTFSEKEIRAIVETAGIPDPEAEDYLIEVLMDRREKIGRYWFKKVNPLDKFKAQRKANTLRLSFSDLAADADFADSSKTSYRFTAGVNGQKGLRPQTTNSPVIEVDISSLQIQGESPVIYKFQIHTLRNGEVHPNKRVDVYVAIDKAQARVVGLERED